ncbi:MAG: hypothetical protein K1W13_05955, partial [Lachnospiraceae bacterium]
MKRLLLSVRRRIHTPYAFVTAMLVMSALVLGACAFTEESTPDEKTGAYSSAAAGGEEDVQAWESLYAQGTETAAETAAEAAKAEEEGTDKEEMVPLLAESQSGKFYYDALTEEERAWYVDMYAIMEGMYTGAALSPQGYGTVAEQEIDKIFQCVMNDHPELFFIKGYRYTTYMREDEIVKISFEGDYTMSVAERERQQLLIDAAVEECLAGIDREASEYEKVKYVYEYLVLHTDYNRDAPENQNICSVFVGGESVCQGYAKAAQYLFDKLGIASTLVVGNVRGGERHAWNLVQVDGSYYYLDATWGDASYRSYDGGESALPVPPVNYDYLCITTKELLKTHAPDTLVPLPECTATAANYYVME